MGRPQGSENEGRRHAGEDAREEAPPFWEWVVAGVGLLLLLASLAYLGWHALQGPQSPPAPRIELLGVDAQPQGGFLVRLRVRNAGGQTAAGLAVSGELKQGEQTLEQSETELDYLPGGSSREAGLFFTRDPRGGQLELSAKGYQKP
jgi:uncharacterized protein (TIGR02588 family)